MSKPGALDASLSREASEIQLADALRQADVSRIPMRPLRDIAEELGLQPTQELAYAIQRKVRDARVADGDRVIGRKIGLTATAVQQQLGESHPDYGALWASTLYPDGATVSLSALIRPKIEAEVAIVLKDDLLDPNVTLVDVIAAAAYALPALEIVDSRIKDWDIQLFDTISDNASSAGFVLGADPKRVDKIALRDAVMSLAEDGNPVSHGKGSDCLGHPLNAAAWLARQCAALGDPLRAGEIIMTGALGPMVNVKPSALYETNITGLGRVSVMFL